jgi:hypothetical protein
MRKFDAKEGVVPPPGTVLDNTIFSIICPLSRSIRSSFVHLQIRMDLLTLILSLLSIGVLQSLALENNMVWQATMTSKKEYTAA